MNQTKNNGRNICKNLANKMIKLYMVVLSGIRKEFITGKTVYKEKTLIKKLFQMLNNPDLTKLPIAI